MAALINENIEVSLLAVLSYVFSYVDAKRVVELCWFEFVEVVFHAVQ